MTQQSTITAGRCDCCAGTCYAVDDGVTGMCGYRSMAAARYAARIRAWGDNYPSPDEADQAIADGWTP